MARCARCICRSLSAATARDRATGGLANSSQSITRETVPARAEDKQQRSDLTIPRVPAHVRPPLRLPCREKLLGAAEPGFRPLDECLRPRQSSVGLRDEGADSSEERRDAERRITSRVSRIVS